MLKSDPLSSKVLHAKRQAQERLRQNGTFSLSGPRNLRIGLVALTIIYLADGAITLSKFLRTHPKAADTSP